MMRLVLSFEYFVMMPARNPTRGSGLGGVVDILIAPAPDDEAAGADDVDEFMAQAAEYRTPTASGIDNSLVNFTGQRLEGEVWKIRGVQRATGTVCNILVIRSISVV